MLAALDAMYCEYALSGARRLFEEVAAVSKPVMPCLLSSRCDWHGPAWLGRHRARRSWIGQEQ